MHPEWEVWVWFSNTKVKQSISLWYDGATKPVCWNVLKKSFCIWPFVSFPKQNEFKAVVFFYRLAVAILLIVAICSLNPKQTSNGEENLRFELFCLPSTFTKLVKFTKPTLCKLRGLQSAGANWNQLLSHVILIFATSEAICKSLFFF